jgi:hypothetical protein
MVSYDYFFLNGNGFVQCAHPRLLGTDLCMEPESVTPLLRALLPRLHLVVSLLKFSCIKSSFSTFHLDQNHSFSFW